MRLNEALGLSFTQSEVDFVIPEIHRDVPLCIDPILMYRSRNAELRELHSDMISLFNSGFSRFHSGDIDELNRLIDFPEVNEIGLGYGQTSQSGRGLGRRLNSLLFETLAGSPAMLARGLKHIEELQLVSLGIGADRISDVVSNILKSYLIDYTQQQACLWDIPLVSGVPIDHIMDFNSMQWHGGYYDLPINPANSTPVLLVPRRIVRQLPWINFPDYARTDFRNFLPPDRRKGRRSKSEVVAVTRKTIEALDKYVERKVRESDQAIPELGAIEPTTQEIMNQGNALQARLREIPIGQRGAAEYQRVAYEVLNYVLEPELTDGELEVRTHLGTERRDIIYTNESERSFLRYVRDTYGSLLLMFEVKNVRRVDIDHINQTAAYLGSRLGMLGIILTRASPDEAILRKTYAVFNDTPSQPRKTILILTDQDLEEMVACKQSGNNPAKVIQRVYRRFITSVQ